ncbi:MAG: hypothetical protein CL537_02920 [Alcanivoracaceae bacterium]|nr:hypothetical protein [Alcanivoracaceae bacterium]
MADRLFQPLAKYGKNHAVDLVIAYVKLSSNISPEILMGLGDAHADHFAGDFPISEPMHSLNFKFSEGGAKQVKSESIGGWGFHKQDPATKLKIYGIEIQQDQISVILGDYESWSIDGLRILGYLTRALDVLRGLGYVGDLSHAGLNVVDVFLLEDVCSAWKESLLNINSIYLPKFIFDTKDYWHSHSGFFSILDKRGEQMLNNCNVSATKVGVGKKDRLKVNTSHHVEFAEKFNVESIQSLYDDYLCLFHNKNKEIVMDVLSGAAAKEIGLS